MRQYTYLMRTVIIFISIAITSCYRYDADDHKRKIFPCPHGLDDSFKYEENSVELTEYIYRNLAYEHVSSELKYYILPPEGFRSARSLLIGTGKNLEVNIIKVYRNSQLENRMYINSTDKFFQSITKDTDTKEIGTLHSMANPIYQIVPSWRQIDKSETTKYVECIIPTIISKEAGMFTGFAVYRYEDNIWRINSEFVTDILCKGEYYYPYIKWWYSAKSRRIYIFDGTNIVIMNSNGDVLFKKKDIPLDGTVEGIHVNEDENSILLSGIRFKKKALFGIELEPFAYLIKYEM